MSENASTPTPAPQQSAIHTEVSKLRAAVPDAVLGVEEQPEKGMYWINVRPRSIVAVAKVLRDDPALDYKLLTDLFGLDRPEEEKRLHVLYNFYSVTHNRRVFVRVRVADGEEVPTLSEVYPSANWAEREVMDLFGVVFEGHPDPRKILLPDDWQGYPLRKDYPLIGRRPVILYQDVKDIL